MGPKKDKKDVSPENAWRKIIEDTPLDDETFKVKVVIIEPAGSDQDRIYMNRFEIFAAEEKRFGIKCISKTETIFMVNQLGCETTVKDENSRVFQEGQSYLKEKKDIPPEILALIIKNLIIKMKEEYLFIKRNRLEVKEGIRRESMTMVDKVEVRGTVSVKPPESLSPPIEVKVKGKQDKTGTGPLIPELEDGKKYNTLLRVRGEEWRDKVYVHDYPIDGPNLYVAVTGFVVPLLPSSLLKIGIPLSAVVQVRIDPSTTKVPSDQFKTTKRGQSQTEIVTEIYKFWEDLQLLRVCKNTADDYKDTAFVVFSPPYWDSESLSGKPDKIYDELCFLLYDIQDLTRQHNHYLSNMDIVYIPQSTQEERFEKYYHQQIDDLPLECVTIYSVLDCILQTVCKCQFDEISSRTSLSSAATTNLPPKNLADDEKIEKSKAFVKEVFNTLCKTEANRKAYRLTYGEEYEEHKPPTVINYGDFAKYSTFHLGNTNLDSVVWSSLYNMPLHKLWDSQTRPSGELEAKINFHINLLLSCFPRKDVETDELNRLIHILACRKLFNNRSSLKKKHLASSTISNFKKIYLKRSILAEPLSRTSSLLQSFSSTTPSFPSMTKSENMYNTIPSYGKDPEARSIKLLFDCPDLSELVSAAELANGTPINHLIDDFEYFEDFSGVSAFQIMRDAFTKFNCVDYKYCEVTDCFVLMFFNSHDKDGIAREEWRSHLSTPLCLEDFFDFVLEEHYDWFQTEEKVYEEAIKLKSQPECKVITDPNAIKSCIGDLEIGLDLLIPSSLKYQELTNMKEQPLSPNLSNVGDTSRKLFVSQASTKEEDIDSKGSKKPKSHYFMANSTVSESTVEIPASSFIGYDLGDRRVEVFGKDATFFSRDGTRVCSMYTLIIPTNIEHIIMNVVPGNGCNEFWVYRALGDEIASEVIDSCESFRITSKNQVMINIKKQLYHVPLPVSVISDVNIQIQELKETKTYYSLFITWPNGLITESVYENNSPILSHIKQYHICSTLNLDESMRCISLNGEVIIYRKSGDIEVLKPDGSFIKILKYHTRLVVPEIQKGIVISEASVEKPKRDKGKEKVKEKPGKNGTKVKQEEDIVKEEEIRPEYELVVEEFEFIETSGLRQKWVNDQPYTIEKLLIRTATDYCLGEVFSRRMDGTYILLNKEGIQIVTFPDKTRIITKFIVEDEEIFPDWTEEEKEYFNLLDFDNVETYTNKSKGSISQKSYITSQASVTNSIIKNDDFKEVVTEEEKTEIRERKDGYVSVQIVYIVENAHFTTVTIEKADDKVTVESPNNSTVVVDSNNNYNINLESATSANFDGKNLFIKYEACPECQAFTMCDIKIKHDEMTSVTKFQQNWLKMKDSFSKQIEVNEEGSISLIEKPYPEETEHSEEACLIEEPMENVNERQVDGKSENSLTIHTKCREMYLAKTIRFFILRRELTCTELVHRSLLDQYKRDCRWQPWCSINQYDVFGDQRSLLSLLTPVHLTDTEKWLMDSKLSNKPKYLAYKDLKKDYGKGFYHWMRPYERFEPQPLKPENVLPPRLPRAFVLRTLEQQWKESDRETYKGAKELLTAILQYRHVLEVDSKTLLYVPIVDLRPDVTRPIDDIIQALAHRIYEDLKYRLAEDLQSRAKADITTKPCTSAEEMSVQGELEEEVIDEGKLLDEERDHVIKQMEDEEEMSPNLRRYWRRRAEEYSKEQFYKNLLREGMVPPYFHDVLSGAMWWDINKVAGEAVVQAERRKMKCVCPGEDVSENADVAPNM